MAKKTFLLGKELEVEQEAWGSMAFISRPSTTGAKNIVCIIVELGVSGFHNFHTHPGQEEVIYLLDGTVEQWVEDQKQVLKKGDGVFIGAGVVHASFNIGKKPAKLFVVVSPCKGKAGYKAVDVSSKKPWNALRQA